MSCRRPGDSTHHGAESAPETGACVSHIESLRRVGRSWRAGREMSCEILQFGAGADTSYGVVKSTHITGNSCPREMTSHIASDSAGSLITPCADW